MKRFLARLLASLMSGVAGAATEDQWRYPVIKDYGKLRPYPNSTAQPDPAKKQGSFRYKERSRI